MKVVLLDTHSFLWFIAGSPRLSAKARLVIEDPEFGKRLSVASLWEMAIKASLGKLSVIEPSLGKLSVAESNERLLRTDSDIARMRQAKLSAAGPIERFLAEQLEMNGIVALTIRPEHALKVAALPFHHRDPFDRLLIAQCLTDKIPIVSTDAALDPYGITRLW